MAEEQASDQDISAELQLQLTQFAMDNASISISWLGKDARVYYVNHYACALLGYTQQEFLQLSTTDVDPNFPIELWKEHWEHLKRNKTLTLETLHKRKDGVLIPVEVVANYVCLDGHEFNVGFAKDITERKRAEAALYEKEEFFRMISENVDDFIAVLDTEGRRLYNNPAYTKLFGSVELLKGTDSFREIHSDDRERIKQLFKKTVQSGIGHRTEFRFVLPNGGIRYMESSGGLIRGSRGGVPRVIVVSHDITERKQAENVIHELAFHDTLTKLPNRRLLRDRLEQVRAASSRNGLYSALMFLDMDNFKPLNDEYGHDAGDMLLSEVSSRLTSCVREMDTVARFGGDELMVLLSELDADEHESRNKAASVAEKIRSALAEPYLIQVRRKGKTEGTIEHRCTASIGVVMFINHDNNPDDIIMCADMAMYQAKDSGRNQVQFYDAKA
jgi:diguanylate cyclase (GGDEF)-like protein/PAS domain S-box-containing protein